MLTSTGNYFSDSGREDSKFIINLSIRYHQLRNDPLLRSWLIHYLNIFSILIFKNPTKFCCEKMQNKYTSFLRQYLVTVNWIHQLG